MSNEKKLEVKTNQDIFKPDRGGRAEIAKILAENPSGDFSQLVTDAEFANVFPSYAELCSFSTEHPSHVEPVLNQILKNDLHFRTVFKNYGELFVFLNNNKDPKYLALVVNIRMLDNSEDLKRLITLNTHLRSFRKCLTEHTDLLNSFNNSNKEYISNLLENQSNRSGTSQASSASRRYSEPSVRSTRNPISNKASIFSSVTSTPRSRRGSLDASGIPDFSLLSPIADRSGANRAESESRLADLETVARIAAAELAAAKNAAELAAVKAAAELAAAKNAAELAAVKAAAELAAVKAAAELAAAEAKSRLAPTIVRRNSQPLPIIFNKVGLLAPNTPLAPNTFFSVRGASDSLVSLLFLRPNEEPDSHSAEGGSESAVSRSQGPQDS